MDVAKLLVTAATEVLANGREDLVAPRGDIPRHLVRALREPGSSRSFRPSEMLREPEDSHLAIRAPLRPHAGEDTEPVVNGSRARVEACWTNREAAIDHLDVDHVHVCHQVLMYHAPMPPGGTEREQME